MTIFSSLYGTYLDTELGTADSTVLFTTTRRKAAINQGVQRFANLTNCWERQTTITILDGQQEYDLLSTVNVPAGDFNKLSASQVQFFYSDASSNVSVVSGDQLQRRDLPWLNRYEPDWQISTTASTGTMVLPRIYYLRQEGGHQYLGFWDIPCIESSGSAKAVVPYIANPPTLVNDNDEPFTFGGLIRTDLRSYHQGIVHYAAHQLEKLRKDVQASTLQMQKFVGYVTQYLQDMRKPNGMSLTFGRSYFTRGGFFAQSDLPRDPRR